MANRISLYEDSQRLYGNPPIRPTDCPCVYWLCGGRMTSGCCGGAATSVTHCELLHNVVTLLRMNSQFIQNLEFNKQTFYSWSPSTQVYSRSAIRCPRATQNVSHWNNRAFSSDLPIIHGDHWADPYLQYISMSSSDAWCCWSWPIIKHSPRLPSSCKMLKTEKCWTQLQNSNGNYLRHTSDNWQRVISLKSIFNAN